MGWLSDRNFGPLGTLLGGENRRLDWLPGSTPPAGSRPPPRTLRSSSSGRPGAFGLHRGSGGGGAGRISGTDAADTSGLGSSDPSDSHVSCLDITEAGQKDLEVRDQLSNLQAPGD